jgi:hypothetical protein
MLENLGEGCFKQIDPAMKIGNRVGCGHFQPIV